jgi:GT2 family glycosyltransferase
MNCLQSPLPAPSSQEGWPAPVRALWTGAGQAAPQNRDRARLSIAIVIATLGRAHVVSRMLGRLELQTRLPDRVIVVGVSDEDVAGVSEAWPAVELLLSGKGSCRQRNVALDHLAGEADVVLFIDDDFLAADDYVEQVERLMLADDGLVGLTGQLLADGAQTGQIAFDDAINQLENRTNSETSDSHSCASLYGCNMAARLSVAQGLRFDEHLPLYGWQEDVDFSCQLAKLGRMERARELTGIHLGTSSGRTSGLRFGYSQVANIIYLRRKGTITARHGYGLMARNIASNVVRSIRPEPMIDHRGRLRGNALAFLDFLRGRVDPRRIESL